MSQKRKALWPGANCKLEHDDAGISDDNNDAELVDTDDNTDRASAVKAEVEEQCQFCDCVLPDPSSLLGNHQSGCPRYVPATTAPPAPLARPRQSRPSGGKHADAAKRSRLADAAIMDSWVRASITARPDSDVKRHKRRHGIWIDPLPCNSGSRFQAYADPPLSKDAPPSSTSALHVQPAVLFAFICIS